MRHLGKLRDSFWLHEGTLRCREIRLYFIFLIVALRTDWVGKQQLALSHFMPADHPAYHRCDRDVMSMEFIGIAKALIGRRIVHTAIRPIVDMAMATENRNTGSSAPSRMSRSLLWRSASDRLCGRSDKAGRQPQVHRANGEQACPKRNAEDEGDCAESDRKGRHEGCRDTGHGDGCHAPHPRQAMMTQQQPAQDEAQPKELTENQRYRHQHVEFVVRRLPVAGHEAVQKKEQA